MALNATTLFSSIPSKPCFLPKPKNLYINIALYPASSSSFAVTAFSQGTEGDLADQEDVATYSGTHTIPSGVPRGSVGTPGSFSSAQTQLDLLDQLTSSGSSSAEGSKSGGTNAELTIRDQLAQLVGDRDDDFTIPLGKNLKKYSPKFLTVSQKRNIKRQSYLNQVSKRNDSTFFATIGAFVLLPPLLILGIAIATGYVQLFP